MTYIRKELTSYGEGNDVIKATYRCAEKRRFTERQARSLRILAFKDTPNVLAVTFFIDERIIRVFSLK